MVEHEKCGRALISGTAKQSQDQDARGRGHSPTSAHFHLSGKLSRCVRFAWMSPVAPRPLDRPMPDLPGIHPSSAS